MIIIDNNSSMTIHEQLVKKISQLILSGALNENDKLPSVRKLALELSINPHTVNKAYAKLEMQKYIYCEKNKGFFVSTISSNIVTNETDNAYAILKEQVHLLLGLGVTKEDVKNYIDEMEV